MRLPGLVASVSVVALLWLTVGAVAARAEKGDEDGESACSGFYVGLAGVYGNRPFVEDEIEGEVNAIRGGLSEVRANADAALGVNLRIGYRLHPQVAAEIETTWRPESDVKVRSGTGPATKAEVESWMAGANAKGYLFLGRIQPYVLVGAGGLIVETKGSGLSNQEASFAMNFAGGADFFVTDHVSINAELRWMLPVGNRLDGFDEFSLLWGLQYHF
jgi:opacity protein-like surface antigen